MTTLYNLEVMLNKVIKLLEEDIESNGQDGEDTSYDEEFISRINKVIKHSAKFNNGRKIFLLLPLVEAEFDLVTMTEALKYYDQKIAYQIKQLENEVLFVDTWKDLLGVIK